MRAANTLLRPAWALAIASAIAGCGEDGATARSQWKVVIASDAPVPQFGDRLLVEILDDTGLPACPECRRQIGAGDPTDWPVSFGLLPSTESLRVRARLFRSAMIGPSGLPAGDALIDNLVALPEGDGLKAALVPLMMRCFGAAADVAGSAACDPSTGQLAPVAVAAALDESAAPGIGSWEPAFPKPCPSAPDEGMACVPGGAFLLGKPREISLEGVEQGAYPERVVAVSPFALDRREVTVGQMRAVLAAHPELGGKPFMPNGVPLGELSFCTYREDGTNSDLAVNCLPRSLAKATCEAMGKRLPTEAEWEWAAGNLVAETRYPWGNDDDVCKYAAVSIGVANLTDAIACRDVEGGSGTPGVQPPKDVELDVSALGIERLGGNVAEFVADDLAGYSSPCWQPGPDGYLSDPQCESVGRVVLRGGSWASPARSAWVTSRSSLDSGGSTNESGFRCAKSFD